MNIDCFLLREGDSLQDARGEGKGGTCGCEASEFHGRRSRRRREEGKRGEEFHWYEACCPFIGGISAKETYDNRKGRLR
jgi:hypothetical protein